MILSRLARNIPAARIRLSQMSSQIDNGSTDGYLHHATVSGESLRDMPKSHNFTSYLPADAAFPTPSDSHKAPRESLGPRLVKGALFTYVRPETVEVSELVGVSPRAMKDLGIREGEQDTEDFKDMVAGNKIVTWDAEKEDGIYPWAQCYGGWQFGSWASQLGDGRAISLFETTNATTQTRYELQLKGAGRTPYSRFADGKAVVRSSIREFVVSEALNALLIPTTRALSLTILPEARVRRERTEPGAIVCRFAQSWLRIGTFDLLRSRGNRALTRQLATYVAEQVFPGWKSLPARLSSASSKESETEEDRAEDEITESTPGVLDPTRSVPAATLQGPTDVHENRFARLYREIVRRNALTVAAWQAYAFTNGVLNTDNTSIYGLSLDFGPFAFLDNFDPHYTPNHDDGMLRYSYKNQPSIIWWNLVRLGEDLGELIGAGSHVDDADFAEKGPSEAFTPELVHRAERVIERAGDEFRIVFLAEYKRLMALRLGLKTQKATDFEDLLSTLLEALERLELDFNSTFRKLSSLRLSSPALASDAARTETSRIFLHHEGLAATSGTSESDALALLATWLSAWRTRALEDWGDSAAADEAREAAMKAVNPKFIPRSWVLDELIERVEKKGEREVLGRVMKMALEPFRDAWDGDAEEEERFCGDVPRGSRAMQCSCSS